MPSTDPCARIHAKQGSGSVAAPALMAGPHDMTRGDRRVRATEDGNFPRSINRPAQQAGAPSAPPTPSTGAAKVHDTLKRTHTVGGTDRQPLLPSTAQ